MSVCICCLNLDVLSQEENAWHPTSDDCKVDLEVKNSSYIETKIMAIASTPR